MEFICGLKTEQCLTAAEVAEARRELEAATEEGQRQMRQAKMESWQGSKAVLFL